MLWRDVTIPNSLTALRIILTPVFLFFLFSDVPQFKQFSLVIFFIAAITDWYDGWIARTYGYVSRVGKFLDPLADKILSIATLFGFVHLGLIDAWMVWVILVRDVLITFLRTTAEMRDIPIVTSKSAQAKTFGEFIVIYYILILYVGGTIPAIRAEYGATLTALMEREVLFGMMLLVTIMTVGTGIMYLFDNRKFIRELYARPETNA